MNEQKAKELLERYSKGLLSPAEKQQLDLWYLEQARKSKLQLTEEELLESVQQLSGRLPLVQLRTRRLWPRIAAAASIVLVLGTAIYFYTGRNKDQVITETFANDVAPGKNAATLTLANGQKILINDALAGKIAMETGVKIIKTATGEIRYEITGSNSGEIAYNTLSTTRGEQTQVRLPDGTLVFLNAESSLKYPTSFTGLGKREVSLTGEGYFEVAKDKKHPFIVESSNQKVEVLGTHFNINTYSNETSVRTTLLEGSVKVNDRILKPNEQSVLANGNIKVAEVEVDNVVAWKNGTFLFEDEPLNSIMRKIERWYDVEVVYDKAVNKDKLYWGGVSRYDNVSKVLEKLSLTGNIHFKIEGRKITVMK
jgi:ferric-dicitrate binding protein FerR (iron transport regulator)